MSALKNSVDVEDNNIKITKKVKSLVDLYSFYTNQEIIDTISTFSMREQELLKRVYGDNYNETENYYLLDKESKNEIKNLVYHKLKRRLKRMWRNTDTKKRYIKNVFELHPDYSKEEVLDAIRRLPDDYQELLVRGYGEDFLNSSLRESLTREERRLLNREISWAIDRRLKYRDVDSNGNAPLRHIVSKNLFELCSNYSKEEVLDAFSRLDLDKQEILKNAYGENLDDSTNRYKLNSVEKKRVAKLILSIKRRLEDPNLGPSRGKIIKTSKYRNVKTVFQLMSDYSEEEVLDAISRLPDSSIELLTRGYGEDYKDKSKRDNLTSEEKKLITHKVIPGIKVRLRNKNINKNNALNKNGVISKNLFELNPDYSHEEVLDAISRLSSDKQELLIKGYGENFDNPLLRQNLNKEERIKVNSIIFRPLRKRLANKNLGKVKPNSIGRLAKNIYELNPDYTEEEIRSVIYKLPEERIELLKKAYGENFDDSSLRSNLNNDERTKLDHFLYDTLKRRLKKSRMGEVVKVKKKRVYKYTPHGKRGRPAKNIFELYPDYTKEQILDAISRFPIKSQELLKKAYGDDFTKPNFTSLTKTEKSRLNYIKGEGLRGRLKDRNYGLRKKKTVKSLYSNIRYDSSDSNSIVLLGNSMLSTNIFRDRFLDIPYRKLSLEEELRYMKVIKMCYYDEVGEEERNKYLNYYSEIFPKWREKYDRANDHEKDIYLEKAIDKAYKYRDEFIINNIRLVISIAKSYHRVDNLENLCQEGIIGMMRAIDKFDIEKRLKFSTYATKWIHQNIRRYVFENTSNIKISSHKMEDLSKFRKVEAILTQDLGRRPTKSEMITELNISEDVYNSFINLRRMNNTTSLDEYVGDLEDATIGDFIVDEDSFFVEDVENKIMQESLVDIIKSMNITSREKEILFMHFGLGKDGMVYSLEEIGNKFGVTSQRISQIENELLKDLRNNVLMINFYRNTKDGNIPYIKPKANRSNNNSIRDFLLKVDLSILNNDLRFILEMRYKLDGIYATYEELAEMYNLTCEDIIKKEKIALKILVDNYKNIDNNKRLVK